MLRQSLQRSPRGEDQPCVAAPVPLQHLGCADPVRAGAFPLPDPWPPVPGGRQGDVEQSVEPPHGVEFGHPAREWRKRFRVDTDACCFQNADEVRVRGQLVLQLLRSGGVGVGARPTGMAVSSTVSRIAATT
jgi:hypothetical protein